MSCNFFCTWEVFPDVLDNGIQRVDYAAIGPAINSGILFVILKLWIFSFLDNKLLLGMFAYSRSLFTINWENDWENHADMHAPTHGALRGCWSVLEPSKFGNLLSSFSPHYTPHTTHRPIPTPTTINHCLWTFLC